MASNSPFDDVRRLDGERCLCAMFAGEGKRAALLALLAFNLEIARIPELVSEPSLGRMRLQWWHQTIDDIYAGNTPDHPVARALAQSGTGDREGKSLLLEILDARERDLTGAPAEGLAGPAGLAGLEAYAEATGGALNQVMARALGADRETAVRVARPIGTAWALTGLLRAIPFHRAQGRRYITEPPGRVAAAARRHMEKARDIGFRPERAMMPVLLPAVLAEYHLGRLEKSGHDPTHRRVRTPGPGRLLRLYLAYLRKKF